MCVCYLFFNIIYNCMILYGIQNHLWIHVVHIPDSVYLSIDQRMQRQTSRQTMGMLQLLRTSPRLLILMNVAIQSKLY